MTTELFTQQLDELLNDVKAFRSRAKHDDCSDVMSETKAVEIATRAYAAIDRVSGKGSIYSRRAGEIWKDNAYEQLKVLRLVGVLESLKADLKAGYLRTLEELIHGELFADFLDMS
jgi:hypothetical protein